MHYSPDEFLRLMEEIDFQGGEHLDETHDNVFHTEFTGDHEGVKGLEIEYCGESALFEIPYGPQEKAQHNGAGVVKVCAVDDMVGRWPRFAEAEALGRP